jgi:hypothetical protein
VGATRGATNVGTVGATGCCGDRGPPRPHGGRRPNVGRSGLQDRRRLVGPSTSTTSTATTSTGSLHNRATRENQTSSERL